MARRDQHPCAIAEGTIRPPTAAPAPNAATDTTVRSTGGASAPAAAKPRKAKLPVMKAEKTLSRASQLMASTDPVEIVRTTSSASRVSWSCRGLASRLVVVVTGCHSVCALADPTPASWASERAARAAGGNRKRRSLDPLAVLITARYRVRLHPCWRGSGGAVRSPA